MTKRNKQKVIIEAYNCGVRRCFVCNCQLVWKAPQPGIRHPRNLATIDHIIPSSQGGRDLQDNYAVMCSDCNRKRGNKHFLAFAAAVGISECLAKEMFSKALIAHLIFTLKDSNMLKPLQRMIVTHMKSGINAM